jgi:hypothetical protein
MYMKKTLNNYVTTAALLLVAASVTAFAATNTKATAPNPNNNGVKIEVQANAPATANIAAANEVNLKETGSHVVATVTGSHVAAATEAINNTAYLDHAANITNSAGIDKANTITAKNEVGSTFTAKNATLNPELNPANTRAGTNITIALAGTNTANNANAALHDANNAATATLNNTALNATTTANLTNLAALHTDAYNAGTAIAYNTLNATTAIPNAYHAVLNANLTNGTIVATFNTSPGRSVHLTNAVYNTNKNAGARIGTTANYV